MWYPSEVQYEIFNLEHDEITSTRSTGINGSKLNLYVSFLCEEWPATCFYTPILQLWPFIIDDHWHWSLFSKRLKPN